MPNKDWRKAATANGKKKKERYIPDAVGSMRIGGTDSSGKPQATQGGMGTTDTINNTVVQGGLAVSVAKTPVEQVEVAMEVDAAPAAVAAVETLEQKALRELLAGEKPEEDSGPDLVLLSAADNRGGPLDEGDAFKRDLESRPDEVGASLGAWPC